MEYPRRATTADKKINEPWTISPTSEALTERFALISDMTNLNYRYWLHCIVSDVAPDI